MQFKMTGKFVIAVLLILHVLSLSMLICLGYNEEFSSTYDEFVGDFGADDSEDAIKDNRKVCLTILTYLTCLKFVYFDLVR